MFAVILLTAGGATAAPSDFDLSFNGTGYALTSVGGSSGANAVVAQSDSKLVAVGAGFEGVDTARFALARYNADGTLDSSFGSGGEVTTTFPTYTKAVANAAVLQPDGKLIVAGMAFSYTTSDVFALARYNPDGTPDTSFGSGGLVAERLSTIIQGGAKAVALQGDGKIVVAGSNWDQGFAVARYNGDGSLDTTFGVDGLAIGPMYGWGYPTAYGLVIQPDGQIVVAGTAAGQVALARFNSDGTPDTSFGSGGEAFPFYGRAFAVALQADGKIVTAGQDPTGFQMMVARTNPDGTPDTSFGSGGEAKISFSPTAVYAAAFAVQIQTNGKIVAAGEASGNNQFVAVARFKPDGTPDGTFSSGGAILTTFASTTGQEAYGLALQTDGRIVVAGRAQVATEGGGYTNQFAVARYQGGQPATREPLYISKNTTLTQDYYSQEIQIAKDGVTLDCAGHSIIGAGWDEASQTGDYVGINLSGHSGVTVKNCNVTGFWYGFLADGNGNTFINNTANANTGFGFKLSNGDHNVLTSNTANDNGEDGFAVGSNTTLTGNTANGNAWSGFTMLDATGSTFTRNSAARNGNAGFYFERGHATRLTNNTATDNLWDGFFFYDSSYNTLAGNTATGNLSHGFFLNGSRANTLTNNTANGNVGDSLASGFTVANSGELDANDNVLRYNTAKGNGQFGIYVAGVENSTLTSNTVRNNGNAGFWVEGAWNNTYDRNTSTGNTSFGFGVTGDATTGNVFSNNQVSGNGYAGFNVWSYAHDNTIKNNTSSTNGSNGFASDDGAHDNRYIANTSTGEPEGFHFALGASGNLITGNTATHDGTGVDLGTDSNTVSKNSLTGNGYGINVYGTNNTVVGNTTNNNSATGIAVQGSSGNVIRANIANSNTEYGVAVFSGGSSNTIQGNVGHNNGIFDGYDENAPGDNSWANNIFGTIGGSAA